MCLVISHTVQETGYFCSDILFLLTISQHAYFLMGVYKYFTGPIIRYINFNSNHCLSFNSNSSLCSIFTWNHMSNNLAKRNLTMTSFTMLVSLLLHILESKKAMQLSFIPHAPKFSFSFPCLSVWTYLSLGIMEMEIHYSLLIFFSFIQIV